MKKLLIATAALAMVAGTAQAQSSVTVYGIVDTGYNSLENNVAGVKTKTNQVRTNGEASTSRFGFRGTEDLGGGMKANFVMESNIGNTNGNNDSTTRNVLGDRAFWAGLEDAKLGQVRIGLQDQFTRSNWLAHDQLAFANVTGNLAHNGNGSGAGSASHTALSTAVNYISPRFSGVQFSLGMTQNDNTTTDEAKTKGGSGSQVGLSYVAGKFSAGLAYVEATTSTRDADDASVQASSLKTKDTSAAASYDFGVAKVAYVYNKRDASQGVVDGAVTGEVDRTSHSFSASFPLTAKLVGRIGYGYGENQTGGVDAYNGDMKGMQAAVNYSMSKRTTAYVIYGDESRETAADAKTKSKEYSVGVRHSF